MSAQIHLGTSSFTADGWNGSFYPKGMKSADYHAAESTRLRLVGSGINVAAVRGDRVRLIHTDGTGERARKP